MNAQLQKEVISMQKQPSCEKGVWPQNARVKKVVKSKVVAKKYDCDNRIMIIQLNLVPSPSET